MTLDLLFRDRAFNRLPIMMLFAVWLGFLWSSAWQSRGGLGWVEISAVWAGLPAYLGITGFHVRATAFEAALPIPARRLWASRVGARALGCVLFLLGVVDCEQGLERKAIARLVGCVQLERRVAHGSVLLG